MFVHNILTNLFIKNIKIKVKEGSEMVNRDQKNGKPLHFLNSKRHLKIGGKLVYFLLTIRAKLSFLDIKKDRF